MCRLEYLIIQTEPGCQYRWGRMIQGLGTVQIGTDELIEINFGRIATFPRSSMLVAGLLRPKTSCALFSYIWSYFDSMDLWDIIKGTVLERKKLLGRSFVVLHPLAPVVTRHPQRRSCTVSGKHGCYCGGLAIAVRGLCLWEASKAGVSSVVIYLGFVQEMPGTSDIALFTVSTMSSGCWNKQYSSDILSRTSSFVPSGLDQWYHLLW